MRSIASRYGITHQRVEQIVREAGVPAGLHPPLSRKEKDIIERMWKRGASFHEIAVKIDRPKSTVYSHLICVGLHTPSENGVKWSESEVDTVRRLYKKVPASKIAGIIGCTRNSVIGKARRLGLCESKQTSEAA